MAPTAMNPPPSAWSFSIGAIQDALRLYSRSSSCASCLGVAVTVALEVGALGVAQHEDRCSSLSDVREHVLDVLLVGQVDRRACPHDLRRSSTCRGPPSGSRGARDTRSPCARSPRGRVARCPSCGVCGMPRIGSMVAGIIGFMWSTSRAAIVAPSAVSSLFQYASTDRDAGCRRHGAGRRASRRPRDRSPSRTPSTRREGLVPHDVGQPELQIDPHVHRAEEVGRLAVALRGPRQWAAQGIFVLGGLGPRVGRRDLRGFRACNERPRSSRSAGREATVHEGALPRQW